MVRMSTWNCIMRLFQVASILLILFESCFGQTCRTTSDSPRKEIECKLPWKFNGKLLNGCTDETDPDGRYWCSTKIDAELEHVGGGGNWGYCDQNCPPLGPPKTTARPTTARPAAPQSQPGVKPPPNGISDQEDGRYHPNEADGTCGEYLGAGFILGGVETKRGELPYQAVLGYKSRRGRKVKYNCGGTLLNRRYVITAAHCQHKSVPRLQIAEVVLGEWNLEHDPDCAGDDGGCKPGSPFKPSQRFDVTAKDVTVHEGWDLSRVVDNGNDIALIRLPRLANTYTEDFDEIVSPVCLGWDNTIEVPKENYVVSGWGRTNNVYGDRGDIGVSGAHSAKLQKLEVPFIDIETCKNDFPIFKQLTEKQLCAGGEAGKDSCSGDSGGPLVATDPSKAESIIKSPKYLIGIVSFGTKKCGSGYPGVYTSIEYYLPWIIANMKE